MAAAATDYDSAMLSDAAPAVLSRGFWMAAAIGAVVVIPFWAFVVWFFT